MGADGSLFESRPVSTVLGARGKCQAEGPARWKEERSESADEENVTAAKLMLPHTSVFGWHALNTDAKGVHASGARHALRSTSECDTRKPMSDRALDSRKNVGQLAQVEVPAGEDADDGFADELLSQAKGRRSRG